MNKEELKISIKHNGQVKTYTTHIVDVGQGISVLAPIDLDFVPYLSYSSGTKCGNIGELTTQTAIFGEKLYVGDVVELYSTIDGKIKEKPVVKDEDMDFIMGVRGDNFVNGIGYNFQIRKVKSYTEMNHGDVVNGIRYNLRED